MIILKLKQKNDYVNKIHGIIDILLIWEYNSLL